MSFKHERLDTCRRQVRLVRILPHSDTDDRIACEVRHFDLDLTMPSYWALSYTWGSPENLHTISVNGKPFTVRRNLYDFLAGMHADDIYIWIDQISIDQEAISERNHQVTMMAMIYKRACAVIIWVGAVDADDLRAKVAVEDFGRLGADERPLRVLKSEIKQRLYGSYFTIPASIDYLGKNDYWRRIWIIQEVLLAVDLRVKWGPYWVDWEGLYKLSRLGYLPLSLRLGELVRYRHSNRSTLFGLLEAFGVNECSDPRDRVYAILGIMTTNVIEVDYSKTVEDVFLDAVGAIAFEGATFWCRIITTCNALMEAMTGGKIQPDRKGQIPERLILVKVKSSAEQSCLLVEYYRKILVGDSPMLADYLLEEPMDESTI